LPDYIHCFALMGIPAIATTMAIIFLRTATNGVQSSLYVVYLNGVGSDRHVDRDFVRGYRSHERSRLAVRRAGDAAR
jgi:hypothetical protein